MDEMGRVADVLVAMSEAERNQALRTIDGPVRRQKRERALEYRPLPSVARRGVTVRAKVIGT